MESFKTIQSKWNKQPNPKAPINGVDLVLKKTRHLKRKQQQSAAVLIATILILGIFFIYISGYNNLKVSLALMLMVGSLIVRIGIEVFSIKKLQSLNFDLDTLKFRQVLIKYYRKRRIVHYIITPLIIAVYVFGFLILMPLFKEALSSGFYLYIQISGSLVLVIGIVLIGLQIQKELKLLRDLMD